MTDLIGVLAALVISALVLRRSGAVGDNAALVAALPAVALGGLSIAAFGVLALGVSVGSASITIAFVAVVAYLGVVSRRFHATGGEVPDVDHPDKKPVLPLPAIAVLVGTALFLLWAGQRWIAAWPYGSADAVNIWTSRALFLSRVAGDIPGLFALMPQGHPNYPLLVPAAVAAQYGAVGSESLLIPQATSILWLFGVVAATFTVAARLSSATVGAVAAAAVATNPLLVRWAFLQCADVPLAYLLLLVAGGLAIAFVSRGNQPFSPPLLGFFVGLLMWTKTEGTVIGAVLVALVGVGVLVRSPDRAANLHRATYFALGLAPPLTALIWFRAMWIRGVEVPGFLPSDWFERITDMERWRVLLSTAAYEATSSGRMGVTATVVLLALAASLLALVVRRGNISAPVRLLWAVPCVIAPIYITAYMLSPYELTWHVGTSVDRLFLHVMPTVMVATVLTLWTGGSGSGASSASESADRGPS